jgi:hypothetical protein
LSEHLKTIGEAKLLNMEQTEEEKKLEEQLEKERRWYHRTSIRGTSSREA